MFKNTIIIIDTDTLGVDLLKLPTDDCTILFIWDQAIFAKRHISEHRKSIIYAALLEIKDSIIINGDSKEVIEYLNGSCIFYASRLTDRFPKIHPKRIQKRFEVPRVEPLPRGFFGFFKKIQSKL